MKYRKDNIGRFDQRPHFDVDEIEDLCQKTLFDFISGTTGTVIYPISTDVLTRLIETHVEVLDLFTDMSDYELDDKVDGFTEYSNTGKPSIYINHRLSHHDYLETRLRTTLAHEFGHVLLHGPLFEADTQCKLLKPPDQWTRPLPATITQRAASRDWMEWQANYAMGAILMPRSALQDLASWYGQKYGFHPPFHLQTGHAQDLIKYTMRQFHVSQEAAKIRLEQTFRIL